MPDEAKTAGEPRWCDAATAAGDGGTMAAAVLGFWAYLQREAGRPNDRMPSDLVDRLTHQYLDGQLTGAAEFEVE